MKIMPRLDIVREDAKPLGINTLVCIIQELVNLKVSGSHLCKATAFQTFSLRFSIVILHVHFVGPIMKTQLRAEHNSPAVPCHRRRQTM